jgi:hypothetical protein
MMRGIVEKDTGSSPNKNRKGEERFASRLGWGEGEFTTSWTLLGLAARKEPSSN